MTRADWSARQQHNAHRRLSWFASRCDSRLTAPDDGPSIRDARLARLEAVLFLAGEPLASRRLSRLSSLADGTEARTLVRRLNRLYDQAGTAFRVEEVAGGFQLLSRPKFGGWIQRLSRAPVESRLSAPAMETLAVVAYRQPVLRADIEAIRGVQCGEMLRQLMERGLVRIQGKSKELGRPFLYGTTKRFEQLFGLRDLDDLPRAAELSKPRAPTGDAVPQHNEPSDRIPDGSGLRADKDETVQVKQPKEFPVKRYAKPAVIEEDFIEQGQVTNAVTEPKPRIALNEESEDVDEDDDWDDDDEDDEEEDDLDEDLDDEWEEVDDDEDVEEEEEDEDWEDEDDDWEDDEDDEDEDEDEDWEEEGED